MESNMRINEDRNKAFGRTLLGVKVIAINSDQLPRKSRRIGPIMGHTFHYRCMTIKLQPGYSIPTLIKK
uniref:Ribosomal protein L23 n=1 Tax=Solanum lycopersicum TaxID=4081 RepID=A0A3Q7J7L6_SOLLC